QVWSACPGWHASNDAADVVALADPDLGPASGCAGVAATPCVYVADTTAAHTVPLVFGPDGRLYDVQPKVSPAPTALTPPGWTQDGAACGTPQAQWQPATWMASAWQAVQGTGPAGFLFQNFRYAVNPFMVGNLFDVSGDGQSAIFARDDPRAVSYWYAGDSDP